MTSVGNLLAYLRLDKTEYDAGLKEADAEADKLAAKKPTVKISVNSAEVIAKLEAVRAATLRVSAAEARVSEVTAKYGAESRQVASAQASLISAQLRAARAAGAVQRATEGASGSLGHGRDSAEGFTRQVGPLVQALALIGPAAIPIAAVAVPALGVLALGIQAVKDRIGALTPEFHRLQDAAGVSLAPGIDALIGAIQKAEPQLQQLIGVFGSALSGELSNIANGLQSSGFKEFIAYAEAELPKVFTALNSLVAALFQVVNALKPVGDAALQTVTDIANLIGPVAQLAGEMDGLARKANVGGISLSDVAKYANPTTLGIKLLGKEVNFVSGLFGGHKKAAEEVGVAYDLTAGNALVANGALLTLSAAQRQTIATARSATTQLGFLSDALNALSGNAVNAEQIELQFRDALGQAKEQVKQNGAALNDNTAKGRANKEWLFTQIDTINQHAEAVYKQTGSIKQATTALGDDESALRRAATAAGLNKDQVNALIRQYAALPKDVSTKVHADTSNAIGKVLALREALASLHDRTVGVTVNALGQIGVLGGGRYAEGGPITGPGTGTSDSIPLWASRGEFIVNAAATAQYLPLLQQINRTPVRSTPGRYAGGGMVSGSAPATVVNITVEGSLVREQELGDIFIKQIDQRRRWRGDIGIIDGWSGQKALSQMRTYDDG